MMKNKKIVYFLLGIIVILSVIAALTGLFSSKRINVKSVKTAYGEKVELYQKGLYARDSVSAATQAKAQDVVTLVLAIPVLLVSVILTRKNSKKGLLLLTGTIGYFLYTYTSYSFMSYYNKFYLIFLALMIASFYAFILCISALRESVDWKEVSSHYPRKFIGIFFMIAGFVIAMMWLGRIVPTIFSGAAPFGLEHYSTLVIQSLDIGFIVPACGVTAYLIYKNNSWGYLLSTIFIVKLVTMAAAVSTMAITMYVTGVEINVAELFVFPIFTLLGVILLWKVMRTVK